jgi:hypothetical protein
MQRDSDQRRLLPVLDRYLAEGDHLLKRKKVSTMGPAAAGLAVIVTTSSAAVARPTL